jgi:Tfp pilus assembly ATPase PilU
MSGEISYENALLYADSANDLRLMIKLEGNLNGNKDPLKDITLSDETI